MKRKLFSMFLLANMLALSVLVVSATAPVQAVDDSFGQLDYGGNVDDLPHPLGQRQRALRQRALEHRLRGRAEGKVHEVARGQFVELERIEEDLIWTVVGEFGDQTATHTHSGESVTHTGPAGPLHNEIPEPDRTVDNATIWTADFSREYYEELLFSDEPDAISMRNFYLEQSSNLYTVSGEVTEWVDVPYNAASYGADYCGSIVCADTWLFVQDSLNAWYDSQIAAGMSDADINSYLSQYDVWDRYDHDGDGNFDEPDGYIDHFQSVHAGEGQETGGGAQGTDAIWSHRWYAFFNLIGIDGPSFNPLGGIQIGSSGYWVGDYTIEPENGGVGVFAHEFAHDLGLPDLYDTSGNTCGSACENSTGFWTLMSSGSYGNDGTVDIGSKPMHMGAWEKFQLGWLDYEVAFAGEESRHTLGPAETMTEHAQGLFVVLPDKEVVTDLGAPYAGDFYYYSGAGDSLDNVMYRQFSLGAGSSLTAQVRYDIELDWDYAYLIASADGGATWDNVETSESTSDNPNGQNFGNGITGSTNGEWVTLTADLSAYSGDVLLGFRYWTDGFVTNPGFMVDEIAVTGHPVDGAESDAGWTYVPDAGGFRVTTGIESEFYFNAYVAEYRQYFGFDDSLRTGPYNFGFLNDPDLQNWVERFSYQDGLLISYWDASQSDNSTSAHPGQGLVLPIDAHPRPMIRADGEVWRSRIQSYDSTFGLEPTEAITLHWLGQPSHHRQQRPVPVFDDNKQYWRPETPTAGVINPHTGTQIRVRGVRDDFMRIQVTSSN